MPTDKGVIGSYQFEIDFDHSQFFLEDCGREPFTVDEIIALYDEAAQLRHLVVIPGCLSILTARSYGVARLDVVVRDAAPHDDITSWDNESEASIEVRSGCLVAAGPETYEYGPRISVTPGIYRVRVYTAGIDTVDEYRQSGDDHYRVVLWPAPYEPPALLHARGDIRW